MIKHCKTFKTFFGINSIHKWSSKYSSSVFSDNCSSKFPELFSFPESLILFKGKMHFQNWTEMYLHLHHHKMNFPATDSGKPASKTTTLRIITSTIFPCHAQSKRGVAKSWFAAAGPYGRHIHDIFAARSNSLLWVVKRRGSFLFLNKQRFIFHHFDGKGLITVGT